jgi:hypothetical protein
MVRHKAAIALLVAVSLAVVVLLGYLHWGSRDYDARRAELLSLTPATGNAAVFLDFSRLRTAPFLAQMLALAPQQTPDSDYAQFLHATGFNYERDLDRIVLAMDRQPQNLSVFAVAEGRFDRKRIEAYGARFGSLKTADGKTLYAVPMNGSTRKAYFTFLRDDRVAWANDSAYFFQQPSQASASEWREHFSRMAGTPVFAILRQDAGAASVLAVAPGSLRSPQLATLVSQLQWISIAGRPEGDLVRVVVEGEALNENTVHQLKELLSGLVVIAQMGLNDAKTRRQLDPALREGYLELLNSADIQQLDRGSSKSVRVIFDVTPRLLQGTHSASSSATPVSTPAPQNLKRSLYGFRKQKLNRRRQEPSPSCSATG